LPRPSSLRRKTWAGSTCESTQSATSAMFSHRKWSYDVLDLYKALIPWALPKVLSARLGKYSRNRIHFEQGITC
jgi:hypothetical protein